MDTRKAVKTYHRNLAIVLAIIVAIFAAIPLVVDKPYIINIFVLTFYMSTLSMAGTFWAASPARTRWVWPLTWVWVPMCAVWWSQRRA